MKLTKSTIWAFVLLLLAAALYRLIPFRPAGFAPQMAMAIFGGAMIRDKKWAIILPVLSLFISDLIFYVLNLAGLTEMLGFYGGQWAIYLVFVLLTLFGSLMKKKNVLNIAAFSITGSIIFFTLSNFITWATGYGFARPLTVEGLMLCYGDALAYYRSGGLINGFVGNFILGDLIWSFVLFGVYYLITNLSAKPALAPKH